MASGKFDHLRPAVTLNKRWYGNTYGGFYVHPDSLSASSVVYSIGIGEDISFDQELIGRHGCAVFGFDPTPKAIRWIETQKSKGQLPSGFHFSAFGVSDASGSAKFFLPINKEHVSGSSVSQKNVDTRDAIDVEMRSLGDIMRTNNHRSIDVLKMDIEGSEYAVLDNLLAEKIDAGQILVEFHDRFFEDGHRKTKRAIDALRNAGYQVFAVSDTLEEVSLIRTARCVSA